MMRITFVLLSSALFLQGCTTATTVQLVDFVEGLERNFTKIESLTMYQLLAKDDAGAREHAEQYIRKRQCIQGVGDPIIMIGSKFPIDLTLDASVSNNVGLVLIAPSRTIGLTAGTKSSARYNLLPASLSSIPRHVFQDRIQKIKDVSDTATFELRVDNQKVEKRKIKDQLTLDAFQLKKDLEQIIHRLIRTYKKEDCKYY